VQERRFFSLRQNQIGREKRSDENSRPTSVTGSILSGRQQRIVMKQDPKIKRPIFSPGNTLVEDYRKAVQWAYDMGLIRKPLSELFHDSPDKKSDDEGHNSND